MDPRVKNLAKILVDYSIEVKPGDWVGIRGDITGMPLINEVMRETLRAGGNPTLLLHNEEWMEILLKEAGESQLTWQSPLEALLTDHLNAVIFVRGGSNTRTLSGVDPEKQAIVQRTNRKFQETRMQRTAEGSFRWAITQFPSPAFAQEADMSLREYEDFVFAATFADQDDPVAHWQAVHDEQTKLVDWLRGKERIEVKGPEIDLKLSIKDRVFINSDGKRNMPSGEIFTGPVEDSVNGWVRFNYPAIRQGREVEGVELHFEAGRVVRATAKKNQDYLVSQLDSDAGARYLGEFAVGTNTGIQRFTKNILFDEKIAGTVHMAVGAGYPETGSLNKSAVHWDFICDMRADSEIRVDGELFYKDGEFQIDE